MSRQMATMNQFRPVPATRPVDACRQQTDNKKLSGILQAGHLGRRGTADRCPTSFAKHRDSTSRPS